MEAGARVQLLHLDVYVDEKTPCGGVLQLLGRLRPQWKPKDIKMKMFTEGITNQLVGCYVGSLQESEIVLVRVYGKMTELYVDRDREVEMFKILHAHDCGPQIYCSFQNGICYEFVRGTTLEDSLLTQPSIYSSKMLHKVYSIKTLSDEMEKLERHLSQINSPTVLCHNDLLTKNIIYNHKEGKVRFIDYEYADYNYQAFDIGNHFNEFAGVNDIDYSLYPSPELQKDWLRAYLKSYKHSVKLEAIVTEQEVQDLYVQVCKFSLASNFFWGLWAILQARYSSIDFDFESVASPPALRISDRGPTTFLSEPWRKCDPAGADGTEAVLFQSHWSSRSVSHPWFSCLAPLSSRHKLPQST
ncbi:ethanolamine kinase 1 isoform X3 [Esox lucius]|uniref:ethanolamine kinase 1 isoform X3 n=1 Tax=Esox lucius TaxID=8010 RepID=UPI00097347E5|nr:ethanolamine kinase 1 isoform X3 [Esox lucius]